MCPMSADNWTRLKRRVYADSGAFIPGNGERGKTSPVCGALSEAYLIRGIFSPRLPYRIGPYSARVFICRDDNKLMEYINPAEESALADLRWFEIF